MGVSPSKPKRVLRSVLADCPACGGFNTCRRIRVTVTSGNRVISDHFTGVECKKCGADDEAELSEADKLVLYTVGLSEIQ